MTLKRIESLLLAPAATVGGLVLILFAANRIKMAMVTFVPASPLDIALMVLGGLVLGAGAATAAMSSLGPAVVGAALTVGSLLPILFTFGADGRPSVFFTSLAALDGDGRLVGVITWVMWGTLLAVGVIFLAVSLLARNRPRGSAAAVIGSAVAGLATVAAVGWVLHAGSGLYRARLMFWSADWVPAGIVVLAVIAVAVTMIPWRWSPLGGFIAGAVLIAGGVVMLAVPARGWNALLPADVLILLLDAASLGAPVAIGAALLGGAVGMRPRPSTTN